MFQIRQCFESELKVCEEKKISVVFLQGGRRRAGGDLGVGHGRPAGGLKIACHGKVNAR